MSEYNSQIPDVNLTDRTPEPEPSRIVAPVDNDTGAVKGKKQGTDGRVKLDESRGFDDHQCPTIQTCTCADLLALGRNSM